ncbi:MAG TPA: urease accessory UreF family protein [Nitrospiraceae bacterium]|jgi:urease accessory protein|nr:urease accessory UreF family protein [Nitrospiraceae bacterium]
MADSRRLDMDTLSLIRGLRFIDSFFPSGGYAFSSGLEAAVRGGAVQSADDLSRYVEDLFRGGISRREAVAVAVAHQAVVTGRLEAALKVDRELDAMKIGRESRMASRQMGRQVIRVAAEQFRAYRLLEEFRTAVEEDRAPGHFPVSIGLALATCGWTRTDTVAAYLYQTAVGFVSAAMKLLPVGQREGQRLLEQWAPLVAHLSRQTPGWSALASWSPVQDIYAMRHSQLESRLFRS